jgi:outer membrane lipoprotein SlyB
MDKRIIPTLLISIAGTAWAQNAPAPAPAPKPVMVACSTCGTVQEVKEKEKKSKTSGVGMVGGAVVGGVLGNQIGGGTGKTLATIGGAAAGGYVGNKAEQKYNAKTVWVTTVKMPDGTIKTFEQSEKPFWTAGSTVKVNGKKLEKP